MVDKSQAHNAKVYISPVIIIFYRSFGKTDQLILPYINYLMVLNTEWSVHKSVKMNDAQLDYAQ